MFELIEYILIGLEIAVFLAIITGFGVLIHLSTQVYRHSSVILAIFALGFTHAIFYGLYSLKISDDFDFISQWVLDIYTFPMLCITTTFSLCVTFLIIQQKCIHRYQWCYVIYVLYILCFGTSMVKFRNLMGYFQNHNCFALGSNFDFNSAFIYACQSYDEDYMCTIFEYLIVYIPFTLGMCTIKGGYTEKENLKSSSILDDDPQKDGTSICNACSLFVISIKKMTIFLVVIMWIVRPVLIVLDVYFDSRIQVYIPWSTMLILYFTYIYVFINHHCIKTKYHADTCGEDKCEKS